MTMQITVTDGNGKPTEIIVVLAPTGDSGLTYTDVDGDRIAVFTSDINGTPGVYFRTDPNGCAIPLTDLAAFIDGIRDRADAIAEQMDVPMPECPACGALCTNRTHDRIFRTRGY
jgi:hypothetical protein